MERNTKTFTHMGAEGATWVGASHFTDMPHVFQNLGDGTYFHSGYLAIRQAIAANTNITYKILYNDAVAMTGGQPHDGNVHPWTISQQVHAEGVRRIALVSDEPDKYPIGTDWAPARTFCCVVPRLIVASSGATTCVTVKHCENSDVLFSSSVAVVVITWPARTSVAGSTTCHAACPLGACRKQSMRPQQGKDSRARNTGRAARQLRARPPRRAPR